jgi:hypothetical protein
MALGSTQPLTETSTRETFLGLEEMLALSVMLLFRKSGSLDISKPYGPLQPATGIALLSTAWYILSDIPRAPEIRTAREYLPRERDVDTSQR